MKKEYSEMSQQSFKNVVGKRKVIVVYGYGVTVDKHNDQQARTAMGEVLKQQYPDFAISINEIGRFGQGRNGWEFDSSMAATGHPSHWVTGSRGYYAVTKNSVFLFPKADNEFPNYAKNFSSTFGVPVQGSERKTTGWADDIQQPLKSNLKKYLERIKE